MNSDRPSLQNLSIFLIGMMGCGKTTVGRALAKQLSYRFFDSDVLVERVAGQPISEIFAQQGEAAFRQMESQVLMELCACTQSVIATGGGIITQQQNWQHLRQGLIIWLDVPLDILIQRLQRDTRRPLLHGEDIALKLTSLLTQRRDRYAQADLTITTQPGESTSAIAQRIIEQIPTVLKDPLQPINPEQN